MELIVRVFFHSTLLKVTVHDIFDPRFFSSIKPTSAPEYALEAFRIWLRIRRGIPWATNFLGINATAEIISTGSLTPQKPLKQKKNPEISVVSIM
jgi:hypothetical protein